MVSLGSWVLFPLVAYAVAAGLGLLAGRLARAPLPPWLVAPVGCCVGVAVALPVYKLGGNVWVGAPLLAALAVAGFVLARGEWRERLNPGWPGAALAAAYVAYLAPVLLSGHWRWLGYNFVNDTAVNMVMIDHVAHHGVRLAEGPASTASNLINGTLSARYPMGLHALLASLHGLVGFLPLEAIYQPFIALVAGLAAMALAGLARSAGVPGQFAAGLGALAMGANLTYQYASHGSFKELTLVLVVAAAAAQCREVLDRRLSAGAVGLLGLTFASGILVFSTAAAPYAAVFTLVLLAAALIGPRRPRVSVFARAAAVGAAAVLVAALPGLGDALAFGRSAETYYAAQGGSSTAFLGHLLRPLPLQESIGIWLSGDYRVPLLGTNAALTAAATVLVALLVAVTAVAEVRARRLVGLVALVPCAAVYAAAHPRLGPYAAGKLLVLLAPAVVFAAGLGAFYLARRFPPAGLAAALALAAGVVASDALAYHDARLAPIDRLEALADAVRHAPPDTPVLAVEWEEWAKYMARDRDVNVGVESFSPAPVDLIQYFSYFGHSVDLDQLKLPYVEGFPSIVLRRGPATSRPPADYRLAYRNEFYELWRRGPGPRVLEHLPLQLPLSAQAFPKCQDVRWLASRTRPADQLLAARAPVTLFDYSARPPAGWFRTGVPGMTSPTRPGRAEGTVELAAGRYRVWVRGSTGRPVRVSVDGRPVGAAVGVNTPDEWLGAGELQVSGGAHRVSLLRGGGGFKPGNGFAGELGPVAFQPVESAGLVRIARADAERRLCGHEWDWVERVRP